jgi:hypothetical protein
MIDVGTIVLLAYAFAALLTIELLAYFIIF